MAGLGLSDRSLVGLVAVVYRSKMLNTRGKLSYIVSVAILSVKCCLVVCLCVIIGFGGRLCRHLIGVSGWKHLEGRSQAGAYRVRSGLQWRESCVYPISSVLAVCLQCLVCLYCVWFVFKGWYGTDKVCQ